MLPALLGCLLVTVAPCASEAQTAPGSFDPLQPDTVLSPPGSPTIVELRAPGSPLVALRVSVPVREAPAEAGAAKLLQILALERARSWAGPVGAVVEADRTPWGISYSVVGAARDFDYLAYLLRLTVLRPAPDRIQLQRARTRLLEDARRLEETPSGRMSAALRERVAPTTPPLGGTTATLPTLTARTLREIWARTHQPSNLTVTVAGSVPTEVLFTAVQGMGAPERPPAAPPEGSPAPVRSNRTQVLRHWYGEAYRVEDTRNPRVEVAALLVAEALRATSGEMEARVEVWHLRDAKALALVGAAYPEDASAMTSRIRGALEATAEGLTPDRLDAAIGRVRKSLLYEARTPGGRVAVAGRHRDETGDPDGARAYLDALDDVTMETVVAFLLETAARPPMRAEVTP